MLSAWQRGEHRAPPQRADAFDDVPVCHDDANEWDAGGRGTRRAEGALAFEDADEPVEFLVVYGSE